MSISIALAGNPNSGKTTLFNALTGSNQFIGNWPGVTVEKKEGKLIDHDDVTVTDLPGIYSLSPYTLEEVVARNYLMDERPDVILNIVDATNLERNLYLTTQLIELGLPVVIALNMMDLVRKRGDVIDTEALSKQFGCKVVEISALKETGTKEAAEAAISASKDYKPSRIHIFSGEVEHALAHIEEATVHDLPEEFQRWYSVKLFERDEKVISKLNLPKDVLDHIEKDIETVEEIMDDDSEAIITNERYDYITEKLKTCYKKRNAAGASISEKIDRVITNRVLGLPIFAVIMFFVYWIAMVGIGQAATDWANDGLFGEGYALFGHEVPGIPVVIESFLDTIGVATEGAGAVIRGLILDGIVAGVGAVLGFVPQMFVLFFMLSFLEGCGYMARIAFILDRLFRKFGLSGQSFIPMLVGTGCGVPGIMASRTIKSERDRRMTIMTTTFMPCSAKLPFISMIATAIFGGSALIATSAYFLGMAAIIVSGIILKKTKMFMGDPSPFVMELPSYHLPTLKNLLRSTWERGWSFIKKAGTIILLSTICVWFVSYFGFTPDGFRMLNEDELDLSILAAIGSGIKWIFAPLGWGTWQAAVATITGLVAKENIVGTMGVLYGSSGDLQGQLSSVFTGISAYSFLVFNLLCAPCFAAIGAIKREMNSAKWTLFAITYQCCFAYAVSLMINQFGLLITGNANTVGLIFAIAVCLFMLFMLFKPYKESTTLSQKTIPSTVVCDCKNCKMSKFCHM